MGIKHQDVKASGDKGYASEWNADHVVTGNVDFVKKQPLNMVIENRTDYPAGAVAGQVIFRTDLSQYMVYDGTGWHALGKREQYWHCSGADFVPMQSAYDVNYIKATFDYAVLHNNLTGGDDFYAVAPVHLPDGATIEAAIAYGSGFEGNWKLHREELAADSDGTILAQAGQNTEDTTIATPVVDNSTYRYWFLIIIEDGGKIAAARIKYSL